MRSQLHRRVVANAAEEFAVLLIGGRFHRPWRVRECFRVFRLYASVLRELEETPGYLGGELWMSRTVIHVQYWQSMSVLREFVDSSNAHADAWRQFMSSNANSEAVGIWHEAYRIRPGDHDAVYLNMPQFGLGKAIGTVEKPDSGSDPVDQK